MSIWPTEEQMREFESGKAPWSCVSSPSDRCKCGILATEGVMPSELGYGSFCGNAHGDYWEGRTCDWEDFSGRYDLLLKLGNTSEPWKSRKQQEIKQKIRKEYDVPIPDNDLLWGKIYQDMVHETGVEPEGLYARETIIKYWRQNRSKYPRPLTENEKRENRRKLQEERKLEKQRLREERDRLGYVEEYLQQVRARKRRIEMEELQQKAEEAQMETMKALVADLPVGKVNVDKKGKGVVVAGDDDNDDDDDDEELLYEGDSD
ncbi:hypothetical protein SETIT_5G179400v2 [Setaria italica]|uniref:Uncharacterized protein n=1 Tax=Setaria italica TaxID=4555 RepID=A0A368R5Z3_SETIT|nr:hypothetical protein SETIT_5G179400v2 [Setaria italica]